MHFAEYFLVREPGLTAAGSQVSDGLLSVDEAWVLKPAGSYIVVSGSMHAARALRVQAGMPTLDSLLRAMSWKALALTHTTSHYSISTYSRWLYRFWLYRSIFECCT